MIFLAGAGAGAIVATILLFITIHRVVKRPTNDDTYVNLMKRRNIMDEERNTSLRKIADWCDHNWTGFSGS